MTCFFLLSFILENSLNFTIFVFLGYCYGLSSVEALIPNMMVFGDETLGRQIGLDEVISPYDGTGALIKG